MGDNGYLNPTRLIDCDAAAIREKAKEVTGKLEEPAARAEAIFYFVRDEIAYNIYAPKGSPDEFKASRTLARGSGYCVQKALLLVALARASGIPARLCFAMIRNHRMPPRLWKVMKTDIFPWHGYAELLLDGRWVKETPAFDIAMCREHRILPVRFDPIQDAKLHPYDQEGNRHIEYLLDRGPYENVPLDIIWQELEERGLRD